MSKKKKALKNFILRITPFLKRSKNVLKSAFPRIIKKSYSIISVISTLTIFSALLLFIFGKTGLATSCDDDLIMQSIKKQMPENLSISSITMEDIHGFGNDSIIVLADSIKIDETQSLANQILIFDQIDNGILNRVYNLFGYGSNYKLSYMFSLESEADQLGYWGYSLKLLDAVDLTGDMSKELIVKFEPIPSGTSTYYQIGVFSYSYKTHSYYLLGTYPPASKYQIENKKNVFSPKAVDTIFSSDGAKQNNYYDKTNRFQLECGYGDDNDIFINSPYYGLMLVRTRMIWGTESHVEPHRHTISLFVPKYNIETDELQWEVVYSADTDDYIHYCTKDYILDYLSENYYLGIEK